MKNIKLKKLIAIICIFIYLLPYFIMIKSFGFEYEKVEPGDIIEIPPEIIQGCSTVEKEDRDDWAYVQKNINEVWVKQGKPKDENNWAYITTNSGEIRYLVALAETFGVPGDYVDIYVEKDGEETIWPCMIGDTKRDHESGQNGDDVFPDNTPQGAYWYNDMHWGHTLTTDENGNPVCTIVELMMADYTNLHSKELSDFEQLFFPVIQIQNGGNYFENPDGPIGLTGTSRKNKKHVGMAIYSVIIKNILLPFIDFLNTGIDSHMLNKNVETNLYDLNRNDDVESLDSVYSNSYNGNIMEVCREVTEYLIDKKAHYDARNWEDIEYCYNNPDYNTVCVTYVCYVLWKSGLLTKEQINAYNYHWTGDGGIPDMLNAAGWKIRKNPADAVAGDVVLNNPGINGHVLIYAGKDANGNDTYWDQNTGVISSYGNPPTGKPIVYNSSYLLSSIVYYKP